MRFDGKIKIGRGRDEERRGASGLRRRAEKKIGEKVAEAFFGDLYAKVWFVCLSVSWRKNVFLH